MKKSTMILLMVMTAFAVFAQTRNLSIYYEELTAVQFAEALKASDSTCIIPMGILEKHGPHLPLGTDLIDAREIARRAARKEYAVIFPPYFVGQIFEAKHQPGTIAYSQQLMWNMLQETCDELARNGFKKIIIVNGHGGNNSFLTYFGQVQLASRKPYAFYFFRPVSDPVLAEKIKSMRKTTADNHAGETETAMMLAHRPDLVHLDKASTQSGSDLNRLANLENAYTAIWWYARYPNHYAGDGAPATKELGELLLNGDAEQLVKMIRSVKADRNTMELQKHFYDAAEHPNQTVQ